jgi:hypothetical protein
MKLTQYQKKKQYQRFSVDRRIEEIFKEAGYENL